MKPDWTTDLPSEFERRRGYELAPWLPLVLHYKVRAEAALAESIRRVRFDYNRTLVELFHERFIEPFHRWCHDQRHAEPLPGLRRPGSDRHARRVPGAGHPRGRHLAVHPGRVHTVGAAVDDIRYAVWNKYAASAGHLTEGRASSAARP